MNRLIKFSVNNLSKYINNTTRPILISSNFFSSKKGSDKTTSKDESEQIKSIETNEENYFENVKQSFENLKKNRQNESVEEKRSRLMYQSRKRGTLENGLLLSHFSAQFLPDANEKDLDEYDKIINSLTNEWDLYYWLTGASAIPAELEKNQVLKQMKKFSANESQQSRIVQPDLKC